MNIYILEKFQDSVPADDGWLSTLEIASLSRKHFAKRRADWRLGRWTAKHAIAWCLHLEDMPTALRSIEILPHPSGAPEAFLAGTRLPVTISVSHRGGNAICAVGPADVRLGCDLELIEPHSPAFITDYFTAEEQTVIGNMSEEEKSRVVTLMWCAKESALKALHEGLRLDTRSVSVTKFTGEWDLNGWRPLQLRHADGGIFHGWWQTNDWVLRTVVADPAPDSPIIVDPTMQPSSVPFIEVMAERAA